MTNHVLTNKGLVNFQVFIFSNLMLSCTIEGQSYQGERQGYNRTFINKNITVSEQKVYIYVYGTLLFMFTKSRLVHHS